MTSRKHAIITGAAGDIGAAAVAELLSRDFQVTAVDIQSPDRTGEALQRLDQSHLRIVSLDLTDRTELQALIDDGAPVDVAVGNAGVGGTAAFLEVSHELWDRTLAVNLTGNFHLGQIVAAQMVQRGAGGRIVFTGSWVGAVPWPDITAYSVSKAALVMLAKQMARELAANGILVNVVAPGIVEAGMAGKLLREDPIYAARAHRVVPLGRFQTPAQVAAVMGFLCSDAADYITGTVLLADGGASLFQFDSDLGGQ